MTCHRRPATALLVGSLVLLGGSIGVVHAKEGARAERSAAPVTRSAASAAATSTSTTAAPTTTTLPPTTTTAAPALSAPPAPPAPPTTVAAPVVTAPAPTVPVAPPPPAPAAPSPLDPLTDPEGYANQLLREVIPGRWLAAVPATVSVIGGKTSWSYWSGLIEIGQWHVTLAPAKAKNVIAHEWGHQVAWHYGTDAYNGAPPAGFPYNGPNPAEQWADCVGEVLSGVQYPTGGLAPCSAQALAFTSSFLAAGPGPALR